jgi:REP element-mobilizing transposase RayT
MPTHKTIPFDSGVFSITFTCTHWLPLIEEVQGYDLIYNWFDLLKANRNHIIGYVIMPNHLHAMIGFTRSEQKINTIIGNGKRFLAYSIIKRLEQSGKLDILNQLNSYVGDNYTSRKKKHQVWEYSFDWKHCMNETFMLQKLNYYHKNPCVGKWMLAPTPEAYQHSSALFYNTGNQGLYEVTHYCMLVDMEW